MTEEEVDKKLEPLIGIAVNNGRDIRTITKYEIQRAVAQTLENFGYEKRFNRHFTFGKK